MPTSVVAGLTLWTDPVIPSSARHVAAPPTASDGSMSSDDSACGDLPGVVSALPTHIVLLCRATLVRNVAQQQRSLRGAAGSTAHSGTMSGSWTRGTPVTFAPICLTPAGAQCTASHGCTQIHCETVIIGSNVGLDFEIDVCGKEPKFTSSLEFDGEHTCDASCGRGGSRQPHRRADNRCTLQNTWSTEGRVQPAHPESLIRRTGRPAGAR